MAIYDLANDEQARFAKVCAPGNTADVTIAELLAELVDDPASRTLCFLLESVRDGRAFVEHARRATPDKPVIVAKTGRSEAGRTCRGVAHGGAGRVRGGVAGCVPAGRDRRGALGAGAARRGAGTGRPAARRPATGSGSSRTPAAPGVELADLLADEGLTVPALSPALQERIRQMLPAYASPVNPVDMTPVWSRFAELYPALVDVLARSGEVDAVVPGAAAAGGAGRGRPHGPARRRARRCGPTRVPVPVYVCWVAPRRARPPADLLAEAGLPVFDWPSRMARAVGLARRYAVARQRVRPPAPEPVRRTGPVPAVGDPVGVAALLARFGVATAAGHAVPHRGCRRRGAHRVPGGRQDRRSGAPHRAGRGAAGARGRRGCPRGRRRAARHGRRGAGAAPAQRDRGGRRRVPRPVVRADGDGRARRHLGRGARRRRVRVAPCRSTRPATCSHAARTPAARRQPRPSAGRPRPRWPGSSSPSETCSRRSRRSRGSTSTPCSRRPTGPSPSTGRSSWASQGMARRDEDRDHLSSAAHDDSAAGSP